MSGWNKGNFPTNQEQSYDALDSFLKSWSRNMENHEVGKYSQELQIKQQAKPVNGDSRGTKS